MSWFIILGPKYLIRQQCWWIYQKFNSLPPVFIHPEGRGMEESHLLSSHHHPDLHASRAWGNVLIRKVIWVINHWMCFHSFGIRMRLLENKPHTLNNDIRAPQVQRMRPEAYGWDLLELEEVPGPEESETTRVDVRERVPKQIQFKVGPHRF